jgi:hypothetical protein
MEEVDPGAEADITTRPRARFKSKHDNRESTRRRSYHSDKGMTYYGGSQIFMRKHNAHIVFGGCTF